MGEDASFKRMRLEAEGSGRQKLPLGGGGGQDSDLDLFSRLPDEVLGDIITLLPTRDGARTQAISRRWRPLWRAAPLNLEVGTLSSLQSKCITLATEILSDHPGPGRRFVLPGFRIHNHFDKIDGLLRSRALTGLQEIDFRYSFMECQGLELPHPLPRSALRFAPTLCVAEFGCCDFPNEVAPSLNFPHLKKLALRRVTISEDGLHSLLSGCSVLESLLLDKNVGIGRLRISSPTLRSIGFEVPWGSSVAIKFQELVIEDAPCLERLLSLDPYNVQANIHVIQAPKLKIVGMVSAGISKLELGTTVFQGAIHLPASRNDCPKLDNLVRTVKVLALYSLGPNLDSAVDFLKCFPCVEKLYIMSHPQTNTKNARRYNAMDPIECLELHLKKVVLKNYCGRRPDVNFAKFFVLNAKMLKEMDFGTDRGRNDEWLDNQHRRLKLVNKASPGARFAFGTGYTSLFSIHGLPNADPFGWHNREDFLRFARVLN